MGQKINPHILRLGINQKEWNNKYLEKNIEESSFYIFKTLEIQKYVSRFFFLHGLLVHTCKIRYTDNSLNLHVSFYCSKRFLKQIQFLNIENNFKTFSNLQGYSNIKKTFFKVLTKQPKKRIKSIKNYKNITSQINFKTNQILNFNSFSNKLIECLSKYTKNNIIVNIVLQNLNKGLSLRLVNKESQLFRKLILRLRKFSNNEFFKETINVVLISLKKKNSAKFLCEFIAREISQLKRHNYYLNFLKEILLVLVKSTFSSVNGIKIVINGRFNGAPRSKKKIILVGNVPTQTIISSVDYYKTTSYTQNGTFGVHVWITEK
uniref:Ribosomal protein S3 n=1 Tax=Eucampia zodiacus TaxID=444606 RepID=A0A7T0CRS4_9STRA|nr:ribosomal protein S3 [Eucampia zodiacus]QPJ79922.1 ribosomal protein S3 [Eucampia zodiacus]